MKRFFTIIYVLLTASAFCADIPAWLKKPEKEFPEAQYIRALGEGNSVQAAKNTALTEISLYFDTKTDIIKHSINELSELVKNGEAQFSSVESYKTLAKLMEDSLSETLKQLENAGATIRELSPEEVALWKSVTDYHAIQDKWLSEQNLPEGKTVIEAMRKGIEK